jgi:hypothetical protein
MNNEEIAQNVDMSQILGQAGGQATLGAAAQVYLDEQNRALAEKQLDVKRMRAECYYLLKQYAWNPSENGEEWTAPKDASQNILTEWGVDRIMQIIHFYINQNNLLSNFTDEEIRYLMQKFLLEINDLVLLKYEFIFVEPKLEECQKILEARIANKKKMRMYAIELLGKKADEGKIDADLAREMEGRVSYEINKIKLEQRKQRLREFSMILAQLEVIVLGALNRALGGEERGSLRRHTQMLEMIGASTQQAKETGGMFKWLKGG